MEMMWPSGEKVTIDVLLNQGRVGLLYGSFKHNITTIREMSCAKIRLNWETDSKELDDDQITATVSGEPDNVSKALELIAMDTSDDLKHPTIRMLLDPKVTGEDDANINRVSRFTKADVEVVEQGKSTRKLVKISGALDDLVDGLKSVVELCEVETDDEEEDEEEKREWSLERDD